MTPKRILIVDDEPYMRSMIRQIIEPMGFEVLEAENGEAGWSEYQKSGPDLTISDISMPKMTGLDLLRSIRQHDRSARVILISGCPQFFPRPEDRQSLPNACLAKPFPISQLIDAMNQTFAN